MWFNTSASQMEKIRMFKRRVCLGMFAKTEEGFMRHYSNKTIYDRAGIPRIDNFAIKFIRDHFANSRNKINSLIYGALYPNPLYHAKTLTTGYIPPEAFLYLNTYGYIQDKANVPTIYHVPRHKNKKQIQYRTVQKLIGRIKT